jgi:hypothetical protein
LQVKREARLFGRASSTATVLQSVSRLIHQALPQRRRLPVVCCNRPVQVL